MSTISNPSDSGEFSLRREKRLSHSAEYARHRAAYNDGRRFWREGIHPVTWGCRVAPTVRPDFDDGYNDAGGGQKHEAVLESEKQKMRTMLDWSAAEHQIRNAKLAVEKAGADTLLTDAVFLLGQAQDKVAEYYESLPFRTIAPQPQSSQQVNPVTDVQVGQFVLFSTNAWCYQKNVTPDTRDPSPYTWRDYISIPALVVAKDGSSLTLRVFPSNPFVGYEDAVPFCSKGNMRGWRPLGT